MFNTLDNLKTAKVHNNKISTTLLLIGSVNSVIINQNLYCHCIICLKISFIYVNKIEHLFKIEVLHKLSAFTCLQVQLNTKVVYD